MFLSRTALIVMLGLQLLIIVTLVTLSRQRELATAMELSAARAAAAAATSDFNKCNRRVAALEGATPPQAQAGTAAAGDLLRQLKAERSASVEREKTMLDQLDAATASLAQCRSAQSGSGAGTSGNKAPVAAPAAVLEFGRLREDLAQCRAAAAASAGAAVHTVAPTPCPPAGEELQLHRTINSMRDELSQCHAASRDSAAQLSVLRKAAGDGRDCPRALLRQYPTVAPVRALEPGITLAMHLDKSRLASILKEVAPRWPGPIAIAVFATSLDDVTWIEGTMKWIDGFERTRYSIFMYHDARNITAYPVNYMRNQALLLVRTVLFVLLDGDFVPDAGLYARFSASSPTYAAALEAASDDEVLVVPCFFQMNRFAPVPPNKTALLTDTTLGGPSDPPGRPHHGVTDYARWRAATADYAIDYQFFYEPYFVQATRRAPFWDERFVYYGFDKVVYVYVLARLGFKFTVLADHFAVHKPHPRDPWYEASGKKASDDAELHLLVDRVLREWGDTANEDWRLRGQQQQQQQQ